jgi:microcystin-dependent protein
MGRVAIHWGQGAGLSNYVIGQAAGVESVTLLSTQIPSHTHALAVSSGSGTAAAPAPSEVLAASTTRDKLYSTNAPDTQLLSASIGNAGGNQPHTNIQPYLSVTFIIALVGIFPSRN